MKKLLAALLLFFSASAAVAQTTTLTGNEDLFAVAPGQGAPFELITLPSLLGWLQSQGLGAGSGSAAVTLPSFVPQPNQFITGLQGGVFSAAQPSCANLSNAAPSCSTDATNASNIATGTLPLARLPALTCANLAGAAPSCATDTTNASNIGSGTLAAARLPGTVAQTNTANAYTAQQSSPHVLLTYAAQLTPNLALGNNFKVTLTGNVVLENPTGMVDGQCGTFKFIQDSVGSRTISYGTAWKFPNNNTPPALSTAANAEDVLAYCTDGTSEIDANLLQAF